MAAVINVCVDPRLNHEVLRAQVQGRLEQMRLPSGRIFITNDIAGNIGSAVRNTVELLARAREEVVMAAVLHHDDCAAARQGLRVPLTASTQQLRSTLEQAGIRCPVLSGEIHTESNTIVWTDRPAPKYELFTFRMPRL
jgi:hypothetical protein